MLPIWYLCRLSLEEPRRRQSPDAEMIEMCDNWLRVDRIELTVFVDNAPAIKGIKKYGFEIEGTGKKYALRNGEYVDAYYMARVK